MPSRTPTELNENWGTNYGLDGFFHEMDYGAGLRDRGDPLALNNVDKSGLPGTLSSGKGPGPSNDFVASQLNLGPNLLGEDFQQPIAEEEGFDLGADTAPILTASVVPKLDSTIVDYSWLENAFQDPDRVPRQSWDSISKLEKLWGNRTTGVHRIDLKDREEAINRRLSKPVDDDPFNIDKISKQKTLIHLIQGAMRKSASHVPLNQIAYDLFEKSGHDVVNIRKPFKRIQEEHGLVGNIYIRASAYPNLAQGKWNKQLKIAAKTARYLVADQDSPQVRQAAQVLGLSVVSSPDDIPWEKEVKVYLPALKAAGKVIDKSLPPKVLLKKAFLSPSKSPRLTGNSHNPQEVLRSNLTHKQAQVELERFKPEFEEVRTLLQQYEDKEDKKALKKLGTWVKSRLLTHDELKGILSSKIRPYQAIEKVAMVIANRQVKSGEYQGEGNSYRDFGLSTRSKYAQDVKIELEKKAKKTVSLKRKKVFEKIGGMVRANLISQKQADSLQRANKESSEILRIAELLATQSKVGRYSGHYNEALKKVPVSTKEISSSLENARKQAKKNKRLEKQAKKDKNLLSKVATIEKAIHNGVHGQKLVSLISNLLTPEEGERVKYRLNPLLVKYNALGTKQAKQNNYQGSTYTEFRGNTPNLGQAQVIEKDLKQVAKFASQQMNMGLAGPKLDQALAQNIHPQVLTASGDRLFQIRKKHEGLAGFAYIDPTAYSTKGVKGCEKGAAIHRNASVPYVMAMSKCGTCVHNSNNICNKYKKRLITKVPHDNVADLKTANIKKASLSQINEDSFFADNGGYVDDYGLEYPEEKGFSFSLDEKENTTPEKVEFAFGGMVL